MPMMTLLEARIFTEDEDRVPLGGGRGVCFTIRADVKTINRGELHPDTFMILLIILGLHKQLEQCSWFLVT